RAELLLHVGRGVAARVLDELDPMRGLPVIRNRHLDEPALRRLRRGEAGGLPLFADRQRELRRLRIAASTTPRGERRSSDQHAKRSNPSDLPHLPSCRSWTAAAYPRCPPGVSPKTSDPPKRAALGLSGRS